jgi:hypothetical protein
MSKTKLELKTLFQGSIVKTYEIILLITRKREKGL